MTLHLNFAGSLGSRQAEHQQQHIREARKELKERVRNDWDYPTLPAHRSSGRPAPIANEDEIAARVAGFRFHQAGNHDRANAAEEFLELGFVPVEWREREYFSESDSEGGSTKRGTDGTPKQKAYQFDSPDSVGSQVSERRMAQKRKHRQALEKEMEWNDGLAHWLRRRDVWSCARTRPQVDKLESQEPSSPVSTNSPDQATGSAASSFKSPLSSPRTSTSTSTIPPLAVAAAAAAGAATASSLTAENDSTPPSSSSTPTSSPSTSTSPSLPLTDTTIPPSAPSDPLLFLTLIPLAPPLLPNNPIRRRISSNVYPDIYGKVILQSRAPSVPINLATLIRALVQGWKDDGEWPPKAAAPEKAIGRKKGAGEGGGGGISIGRGVKAVGRVLRLTGTGGGG